VSADTVFVETAARLHFGVLDLRRAHGRWFGGIGASAPAPTLLVSVAPAATLVAEGDDARRAADCARTFLAYHRLDAGAHITVHRALPPHAGLGSGTQLALAVARALAERHGLETQTAALSLAVGRGQRSAVGTWTFDGGGLVVEGGRRAQSDGIGPLIARLPFPRSWRCIVAVPAGVPAISGKDETEALARLPPPPDEEVERIAHLVLLVLLPALADGDLPTFGRALTSIQAITGEWFAPVQGGAFAPGPSEELVRRMAEWGASGVGQSSWGPTVYAIVDGDEAGRRLADRVQHALDHCGGGTVYEGAFRTDGARVWRAT